ncbi:hypothetical protein DP923_15110 [Pontibacter arcticus]|uniref:Uncharacterized protein n=1 Tax=Pontibacter arcticus TaxID=2080288 RepID=A0A364RCM6_9BACT|nr:hypothetical protein DP923_15110 [Pontibacter arcticus]
MIKSFNLSKVARLSKNIFCEWVKLLYVCKSKQVRKLINSYLFYHIDLEHLPSAIEDIRVQDDSF